MRPGLPADAIVTDVSSIKAQIVRDVVPHLPTPSLFVPGHPVAGTEHSGPDAAFATLFERRRCILTPIEDTDPVAVERVRAMWELAGSIVDVMTPEHHDRVLAITSHLPHLIAYTIVGTVADLEDQARTEVFKYAAGGFTDFTRIAASDPTMWRDVLLGNREAVLEMLGRFTEDLVALQRAIRWSDGETLFELFERTRAIRRGVIQAGQAYVRQPAGATARPERDGCAADLVWYFGYGSLMWNPGIAHEAFEPARLEGWSRALCVYSTHYRGTAARPGLVLGLLRGGSCIGRAIGVAPEREAEVTAYLDAPRAARRLRLRAGPPAAAPARRRRARSTAWCYVARPEHEHYAGRSAGARPCCAMRPPGSRPRRLLRRLCPQHRGPPAGDGDRRARARADRGRARTRRRLARSAPRRQQRLQERVGPLGMRPMAGIRHGRDLDPREQPPQRRLARRRRHSPSARPAGTRPARQSAPAASLRREVR